jgi:hypothetical protein
MTTIMSSAVFSGHLRDEAQRLQENHPGYFIDFTKRVDNFENPTQVKIVMGVRRMSGTEVVVFTKDVRVGGKTPYSKADLIMFTPADLEAVQAKVADPKLWVQIEADLAAALREEAQKDLTRFRESVPKLRVEPPYEKHVPVQLTLTLQVYPEQVAMMQALPGEALGVALQNYLVDLGFAWEKNGPKAEALGLNSAEVTYYLKQEFENAVELELGRRRRGR